MDTLFLPIFWSWILYVEKLQQQQSKKIMKTFSESLQQVEQYCTLLANYKHTIT